MRFKHTIHVLIDNFRTTYKMLLYILVVLIISTGLGAAIVVPFLNSLGDDVNLYERFLNSISALLSDIANGEIDN